MLLEDKHIRVDLSDNKKVDICFINIEISKYQSTIEFKKLKISVNDTLHH